MFMNTYQRSSLDELHLAKVFLGCVHVRCWLVGLVVIAWCEGVYINLKCLPYNLCPILSLTCLKGGT